MEKIEKIGMFMVPSSADEFIVDILAKMAEKTDEIIDRLNEQPEETEHMKLHKEVFCGVEDTLEEKPVVKKNLTTEKSLEDIPEEWEEEIREVFDANTWFGNGIEEDGLDIQQEDALDMYESIRIIVKQLLEERTFTRNELSNLKDWIDNEYVPSMEARDVIDARIIKKVNRLLSKLGIGQ